MTLVIDASVAVAGLLVDRPDGPWSEGQLKQPAIVAPHVMLSEVAGALRWAELRGEITPSVAQAAHLDLLALEVELFPYELLGLRVWELRANITVADACYVALAEWLDAPLATLDRRLARAPGPRCRFLTPESAAL